MVLFSFFNRSGPLRRPNGFPFVFAPQTVRSVSEDGDFFQKIRSPANLHLLEWQHERLLVFLIHKF